MYADVLGRQRNFFRSGETKQIDFRKEQLRKLRDVLQDHEERFYDAIQQDLGKSAFETFTTEISFIYNEIDYFIKNLSSLAKPRKVGTNIINQLGSSKIYWEPFGNTLAIGAWNYPYQLSFVPAVCALAAGNTVILKPSENSPSTAAAMEAAINENFPDEYFHVFQGGVNETTEILKLRFDKIFFTGSPHIGKIVYQAASAHLTPVTLELGGKSPTVVTQSANIEVAARRIVWGKFLNAGQTCIAPDYLYVHEQVRDVLLDAIKRNIGKYKYLPGSENYTRIINPRHFKRLIGFIDQKKIFTGGHYDEDILFIEPTILQNVTWEDKVMQEEVFGPILPVLDYKDFNEVINIIQNHEKPLSAYIFTNNHAEKEAFISKISFGGGCVNDTVMHISNPNLPFGGIGNSGIGSYHGKFGFEAFSHRKSVIDKATWGEPDLRYPPYTETKKKWIRRLQGG